MALLLLALPFASRLAASGKAGVSEENRQKAVYAFLEAENQRNLGHDDAFHHLVEYAYSLDPENAYTGFCA